MGEAIRGLYHFRFKGICILIFISYALICSSTYVAASTVLRKMLTRSRERQTSAATTCEIKSIFSLFCQKTFLSRKQRWNGYDSLHTLFSIYCFGYVTMKKSKRNVGFVEIRPILWSYFFLVSSLRHLNSRKSL